MTQVIEKPNGTVDDRRASRRLILRHVVLTMAIFLPLVWAFITQTNWYPIHYYRMFYGASALGQGDGRVYYIFRGETASGDTIDIPPIRIFNALDGMITYVIGAAVANDSLQLKSPHPDNVRLIQSAGSIESVSRAALLPDVLRAFGERYNAKLSGDSPKRLVRVRLEAYRWHQENYGNYGEFVEAWSVEL
jgi:hypothetical protein